MFAKQILNVETNSGRAQIPAHAPRSMIEPRPNTAVVLYVEYCQYDGNPLPYNAATLRLLETTLTSPAARRKRSRKRWRAPAMAGMANVPKPATF